MFNMWAHLESNQAPTEYESVALTEWAYFDIDYNSNLVSALGVIFMSLTPISIGFYGYYYFKDFFEDDKYL